MAANTKVSTNSIRPKSLECQSSRCQHSFAQNDRHVSSISETSKSISIAGLTSFRYRPSLGFSYSHEPGVGIFKVEGLVKNRVPTPRTAKTSSQARPILLSRYAQST